MHIIGIGVLFYQVLIATIIIVAAHKGKKALTIAVVLTSLWTLSHVYYPPLMILQFCTIIGSSIYSYRNIQNSELPT